MPCATVGEGQSRTHPTSRIQPDRRVRQEFDTINTLSSLALVLAALGSAPALAQDTMTEAAPPPATEPTPPADSTAPAPATTDVMTPPTEMPPSEMDTETAPTRATPPAAMPDAAMPAPETVDETAPTATLPATMAAPMQTPAQSITPEQQAAYDAWPENVRAYFDGLPASRQVLFQRIEDADKVKLAGLPVDQQETVWSSIEKQDAEQKAKPTTAPQPQ